MAGDWIKWTVGFARKPEILGVAEELGISRHEAAGLVMELFEWLDANTTDGHAVGVTFVTVSALLGRDGIMDSLSRCGWVTCHDDGSWSLAHWQRHNGRTAKSRAQAAERQAQKRSTVTKMSRSERDECHGDSVTETRQERYQEKRREEKEKSIEPPYTPQGGRAMKPDGWSQIEKVRATDEQCQELTDEWHRCKGRPVRDQQQARYVRQWLGVALGNGVAFDTIKDAIARAAALESRDGHTISLDKWLRERGWEYTVERRQTAPIIDLDKPFGWTPGTETNTPRG